MWKDIPDYINKYQASTLGNIRSLDRTVSGKSGSTRLIYGKVLSGTNDGKGYLKVALQTDGRSTRKLFKVHKLIAITFLVKPSIYHTEVNHIDGNKLNNELSNLEWVTPSQNVQHAIINGLQKREIGSKKTRVAMVDSQGNQVNSFNSINEANRHMNFPMSGSGISDNINGRTKSYKGTVWVKI